ncbi:MAG: toprim domain-containing protein [Stellaceae bacterium]
MPTYVGPGARDAHGVGRDIARQRSPIDSTPRRATPAATIAAALGRAQRSGSWWRCLCPVHGSRTGRSATLALRDGPDGLIVHCHADCTRDKILAELHRLGLISGGAVRLAALRPDAPLVIAEGVESVLAAGLMLGCPAWAALSAGGIQALVLPEGARDIVIAVDRDASGVGERAARKAVLRWAAEGRRVRLVIPDRAGCDANDLLVAAREAAAAANLPRF